MSSPESPLSIEQQIELAYKERAAQQEQQQATPSSRAEKKAPSTKIEQTVFEIQRLSRIPVSKPPNRRRGEPPRRH